MSEKLICLFYERFRSPPGIEKKRRWFSRTDEEFLPQESDRVISSRGKRVDMGETIGHGSWGGRGLGGASLQEEKGIR